MSDYVKITEKPVSTEPSDDLKLLITQTEGDNVVLRRMSAKNAIRGKVDAGYSSQLIDVGQDGTTSPAERAAALNDGTVAGWRSIAAGFMSFAQRTGAAFGRLARAIGKGSFSVGYELNEDVLDSSGRIISNAAAVSLSDTTITLSAAPVGLSVGDAVYLSKVSAEYAFTATDARIITEIAGTTLTLNRAFGDVNYTEEDLPDGETSIAAGKAKLRFSDPCEATEDGAVALGQGTKAKKKWSLASGRGTVADSEAQRVHGRFNLIDSAGKFVDIVGAGTSKTNRNNIYTLDWLGNAVFAGKLSAGAKATSSKDLMRKGEVDAEISTVREALDAKASVEDVLNTYETETVMGNPAQTAIGADRIPVKEMKVSIDPSSRGVSQVRLTRKTEAWDAPVYPTAEGKWNYVKGDAATGYATLRAAYDAAAADDGAGVIVMMADDELNAADKMGTAAYLVPAVSVTIDLNGHFLTDATGLNMLAPNGNVSVDIILKNGTIIKSAGRGIAALGSTSITAAQCAALLNVKLTNVTICHAGTSNLFTAYNPKATLAFNACTIKSERTLISFQDAAAWDSTMSCVWNISFEDCAVTVEGGDVGVVYFAAARVEHSMPAENIHPTITLLGGNTFRYSGYAAQYGFQFYTLGKTKVTLLSEDYISNFADVALELPSSAVSGIYTVTSTTPDALNVVVQLGQIVHGGSLNLTTGELTITHNEQLQPITPVTVQLTPVEVRTLLGTNCFYGDTGAVTVTVRIDPSLSASMPHTWELIDSGTIEAENVYVFYRSIPCELREMLFRLWCPASSVNGDIEFVPHPSGEHAAEALGSVTLMSVRPQRTFSNCHVYPLTNKWVVDGWTSEEVIHRNNVDLMRVSEDRPAVKSIKLFSFDAPLPVGTRYEIYGVRGTY